MTLTDETPNFVVTKLVLAMALSSAILLLLLVVVIGCLEVFKTKFENKTTNINNKIPGKQSSDNRVPDSISWIA